MKKRKNLTKKINPPTIQAIPQCVTLPFHETFPIKLTHMDGKIEKICYFVCKEHLQSYITRYKLKKNEVKIEKTEPKNGVNDYGIER